MAPLLALHVLAAVAWVGGMFFAYLVLRCAVGPLEPPVRLSLWGRVFGRFFPWVWAAVAALLLTGYAMVFVGFGGFRGVGLHVHVMQGTGILMMLLYFHLFFTPWRRFRAAVDAAAWADAARQLEQIRRLVAINLGLGLFTVAVGATGRYW
jgi:uncharacterized membrane protein